MEFSLEGIVGRIDSGVLFGEGGEGCVRVGLTVVEFWENPHDYFLRWS